jgi:hypothetical protein
MSLNKKYCNICNHECHCVGHGYYVSGNKCDVCICDRCDCGERILGAAVKKSWWQKIKDWLF